MLALALESGVAGLFRVAGLFGNFEALCRGLERIALSQKGRFSKTKLALLGGLFEESRQGTNHPHEHLGCMACVLHANKEGNQSINQLSQIVHLPPVKWHPRRQSRRSQLQCWRLSIGSALAATHECGPVQRYAQRAPNDYNGRTSRSTNTPANTSATNDSSNDSSNNETDNKPTGPPNSKPNIKPPAGTSAAKARPKPAWVCPRGLARAKQVSESVCAAKANMPLVPDPKNMPGVIFVPGNMSNMSSPLSGGGFVEYIERCFGRPLLDGAVIGSVHEEPDKQTGWCTHTLSTGHVLYVIAPTVKATADMLIQKYNKLRRHLTAAFAHVAATPSIRDKVVWTPLFGNGLFRNEDAETQDDADKAASTVVEETAVASGLKVVICDRKFKFADDR